MTGFMNADGSGLVGGLDSTGVGRALRVDSMGHLFSIEWVYAQTMQGRAFVGTTGLLSSQSGTNNYPLCVFNSASSGKNVFVYSIRASSGTALANAITVSLKSVTTDPAYGSPALVMNARAGGQASAIADHCTFSSSSQTNTGPFIHVEISAGGVELLGGGTSLLLPKASAYGLTVMLQTYAAGFNNITIRWIEFE